MTGPGSPPAARRRSTEVPLVLVVGGLAVGLAVVWLHHFRLGCLLLSAAVLTAAMLRLMLPARQAGMLVVRSRILDVGVLVVVAVAVAVLALVVPPQGP